MHVGCSARRVAVPSSVPVVAAAAAILPPNASWAEKVAALQEEKAPENRAWSLFVESLAGVAHRAGVPPRFRQADGGGLREALMCVYFIVVF